MLCWPVQPLEEECETVEVEVRLLHTRCKNEQMGLTGAVQNSWYTCNKLQCPTAAATAAAAAANLPTSQLLAFCVALFMLQNNTPRHSLTPVSNLSACRRLSHKPGGMLSLLSSRPKVNFAATSITALQPVCC